MRANFSGGDFDTFILRLHPSGAPLIYSTYFGGGGDDRGYRVAVDADGNAYVAGQTSSPDFPVAFALQPTFGGATDAFVMKLNAAGAIAYATYLGGSGADGATSLALDPSSNVYLTGFTDSSDFPVVDSLQLAKHGGVDAFVARLPASGAALTYSTLLGGNADDSTFAIAADTTGNAYVLGQSASTDFPLVNPLQRTNGGGAFDVFVVKLTPAVSPPRTIQFSANSYATTEGCGVATIVVTRAGSIADSATVDYVASDGSASQRTDYTLAAGSLTFAPGETSKSFDILLNEDAYAEGSEQLTVVLTTVSAGTALGTPLTATVNIADNDAIDGSTNPIDDAADFVCQHYHDFLSRQADSGGAAYWTSQITSCGTDPICIRSKRIDVSNAFYFELEFQQTGAYVYRLYRAAFGNNQPFPNPNPDAAHPGEEKKVPLYLPFMKDRARVPGGAQLPQFQLELANAFVQRPEFLAKYPASLDGPGFVDAVLATLQNDIGVNLASQRPALIALFNAGGRGNVMYRLADDNTLTNPINNRAYIDAEYNRAFVFTQYAGYLRRNPDMTGFLFWLGQVNSATLRDVPRQHAMVCSFITSTEYQQRFSSIVTHSNAECPQ